MAAKQPTPQAKRKAAALLRAQKASFLASLADTHLVSEAAKQADVHRQRAYEWRKADESFAAAWSEIEERSVELLEREAYRRAAVGVDKPIYHQGERVDTVKEYSDVLLIFLLKARRPDVYREHQRVELSGAKGGAPLEVRLAEAQGMLLAQAVGGILSELGVKDRPEVADVIRKHLERAAGAA